MATKPAKSTKTDVAAIPSREAAPVTGKKAAKPVGTAKPVKPVAEKKDVKQEPSAKPAAAKPVDGKKTVKPAVAAPAAKTAKPVKAAVKPATETKPAAVKPAVEKKPVKPESPAKPVKASAKPATEKKIVKPEPVAKEDKVPAAAMPKWGEIRALLLQMKEETLREITKTLKSGADTVLIGEPSGDIYDQASSERDRELGLLLGDREREKVHAIDDALLRIDEDEYGICEECDEDIPLGRLKAMPFTRHCVKCKSDLEKFQAQTKRFEEERAYREIPLGPDEEDA